MEKKRDSAAKRTDIKAPSSGRQLRQDCLGARYIRQYRQVLLQAQPYIVRGSARPEGDNSCKSLPTVQFPIGADTRA